MNQRIKTYEPALKPLSLLVAAVIGMCMWWVLFAALGVLPAKADDPSAPPQEAAPVDTVEEEAAGTEAPAAPAVLDLAGFWMPHLISWSDGTSASKQDIDYRYCHRLYNYLEAEDGWGWFCLDSRKAYAEISLSDEEEWPYRIESEYGSFKARLENGPVLVVEMDGAGVMYLSPAARPGNLDRFVEVYGGD